jgi:hypothetical protein
MRPRLCLITITAAALAAPATAGASIGTGVGVAPLTLRAPAHTGHSYTFRWLYVKNTGTVRSSYLVKAERLSPGSANTIPAGWVQLQPAGFQLAPRAIERVTVVLRIPTSAAGGDYLTDLVASTQAPHAPGGTALGAAAADKLAVTIPASSSFPWVVLIVAGGLIAVLAGGWGVRRLVLSHDGRSGDRPGSAARVD